MTVLFSGNNHLVAGRKPQRIGPRIQNRYSPPPVGPLYFVSWGDAPGGAGVAGGIASRTLRTRLSRKTSLQLRRVF